MTHWKGRSDSPEWWAVLEAVRGGLAFDIGANGGTVTQMFARNFAKVVAVEPAVESFVDLQNGAADNVVCIRAACGAKDGTIPLFVRDRSIRTGQLVAADSEIVHPGWGDVEGTRTVRSFRLDTLSDIFTVPDVVKIDVEGSEQLVLLGAAETIAAKQTTWLIEIHSAPLGVACAELLAGYTIEKVFHSGYRDESAWRDKHFYLRATP